MWDFYVYCFLFSSFHHGSLRKMVFGIYSIAVLDAGSYSKPIVSNRKTLIAVIVLSKLLWWELRKCSVCRGWRKLHNEELHNLYSSPSIIRMAKSRRMRCSGHVARMGDNMQYRILYVCQFNMALLSLAFRPNYSYNATSISSLRQQYCII
jgi:hypothetical protein